MHRRKFAARPRVESLEPVTLLSGLGAPTAIVSALAIASAPKELAVHGDFHGTYTIHVQIPDTGASYSFPGKGQVKHFGRMSITGDLQSTGFIFQGHAGGTLTLSSARGTLTLSLTGPPQGGFSDLPNQFTYTVSGGTGRFAHVKDTGTVTLNRIPGTVPNPPASGPTPTGPPARLIGEGSFTMMIRSDFGRVMKAN
jgi:hypothetical protein